MYWLSGRSRYLGLLEALPQPRLYPAVDSRVSIHAAISESTIDERERIVKLPLRLYQYQESFGIQDAEGYSVCYLYFDDDPKRRIVTKRMTKAEAESVAKQIARALTDNAEKAAATPKDDGA